MWVVLVLGRRHHSESDVSSEDDCSVRHIRGGLLCEVYLICKVIHI